MAECIKSDGRKDFSGKRRAYTYSSWKAMMERCHNPEHQSFGYYGGRGIQVCERWRTFGNFLEDMDFRPQGLTIDRLDNDKGYEPGNCRWATWAEQMETRNPGKTQVIIEFNGKSQSLGQWAKELGMLPDTLGKRIKAGWSIERALTTPLASHPAREIEM